MTRSDEAESATAAGTVEGSPRRADSFGDRQDPITVLHVDDDQAFVDLAATFVERAADVRVEVATSGAEALARLADGPPVDCLVSDYQMPGMDGLELLATVREDYPDLPFVLFTGQGSEEIASEAISAGVTDYLQKETSVEQFAVLANRVRNVVRGARAERDVDHVVGALETAREGLALLDDAGTFRYVNRAFADLLGYAPDDLVGTDWREVYANDEATRLEAEVLPTVRDGGRWTGQANLVRADGTDLVADHTLSHTNDGHLVCTVSEDRPAGEGVDEPSRTVVESAVFRLDADGHVTAWSRDAPRWLGLDDAAVDGVHVTDLDGSTFGASVDRLLETAAATGHATGTAKVCDASGDAASWTATLRALTCTDRSNDGYLLQLR